MNKQRFIYLILTATVLISFTACNEAEDSVPTETSVETTLSDPVNTIDSSNIDFVSSAIEETTSSLDYTLPDDVIVVENTSTSEEDTSITTYVSTPDENVTTPTPDVNVTTPTPDVNVTTPTPDVNVTTPTPDENVTTPPEEEIVVIIEYTTGFVGRFIDSFVSGIDYTCDGQTNKTDSLGRFNCQTTPVQFSLGNLSLGTIDKISDDYLVFPQDLLGLQRGAALHPEVTKMVVLLQSLDNDADPENGIIITPEAIALLNQEVTEITKIQDLSLAALTLRIEHVIENNLQTQLQLVAIKQAQDHLLTSLSSILISPIQP